MDGVRVRLTKDAYTGNIEVYVLEREHGRTRFLRRPTPDGQWIREEIAEGVMQRPSLILAEHEASDILQSLAEQLAQMGFVQLNAAPQMVAMREHIADLKVQSERLYALALNKRTESL